MNDITPNSETPETPETPQAPEEQQEIQPKKSSKAPIVIGGVAGAVVLLGVVAFVLWKNGVIPIGNNVASNVSAPTAAPGPSDAVSGPGQPAGRKGKPGAGPKGANVAMHMKPKGLPGKGPLAAKLPPGVNVPGAPGALGAKGAAAAPHKIQLVGVRPDPFAPYEFIGLNKWIREQNRVDIPSVYYSGSAMRTPGASGQNPYANNGQYGNQGTGPEGSRLNANAPIVIPWKVAGIMTGAGVKAILVNGEQSAIVQPGDDLPDDLATVIKITASNVIVRPTADATQQIVLDKNSVSDDVQGGGYNGGEGSYNNYPRGNNNYNGGSRYPGSNVAPRYPGGMMSPMYRGGSTAPKYPGAMMPMYRGGGSTAAPKYPGSMMGGGGYGAPGNEGG